MKLRNVYEMCFMTKHHNGKKWQQLDFPPMSSFSASKTPRATTVGKFIPLVKPNERGRDSSTPLKQGRLRSSSADRTRRISTDPNAGERTPASKPSSRCTTPTIIRQKNTETKNRPATPNNDFKPPRSTTPTENRPSTPVDSRFRSSTPVDSRLRSSTPVDSRLRSSTPTEIRTSRSTTPNRTPAKPGDKLSIGTGSALSPSFLIALTSPPASKLHPNIKIPLHRKGGPVIPYQYLATHKDLLEKVMHNPDGKDLRTILKQLFLFRNQVIRHSIEEKEHSERDLLHAWQTVYNLEEDAFVLKCKEKGVGDILEVHQQLKEMTEAVDRVNNHLAPTFEKLSVYITQRVKQLEKAEDQSVSIKDISARAAKNKDMAAKLLTFESRIRMLERMEEKRHRLFKTSTMEEVGRLNSFSSPLASASSQRGGDFSPTTPRGGMSRVESMRARFGSKPTTPSNNGVSPVAKSFSFKMSSMNITQVEDPDEDIDATILDNDKSFRELDKIPSPKLNSAVKPSHSSSSYSLAGEYGIEDDSEKVNRFSRKHSPEKKTSLSPKNSARNLYDKSLSPKNSARNLHDTSLSPKSAAEVHPRTPQSPPKGALAAMEHILERHGSKQSLKSSPSFKETPAPVSPTKEVDNGEVQAPVLNDEALADLLDLPPPPEKKDMDSSFAVDELKEMPSSALDHSPNTYDSQISRSYDPDDGEKMAHDLQEMKQSLQRNEQADQTKELDKYINLHAQSVDDASFRSPDSSPLKTGKGSVAVEQDSGYSSPSIIREKPPAIDLSAADASLDLSITADDDVIPAEFAEEEYGIAAAASHDYSVDDVLDYDTSPHKPPSGVKLGIAEQQDGAGTPERKGMSPKPSLLMEVSPSPSPKPTAAEREQLGDDASAFTFSEKAESASTAQLGDNFFNENVRAQMQMVAEVTREDINRERSSSLISESVASSMMDPSGVPKKKKSLAGKLMKKISITFGAGKSKDKDSVAGDGPAAGEMMVGDVLNDRSIFEMDAASSAPPISPHPSSISKQDSSLSDGSGRVLPSQEIRRVSSTDMPPLERSSSKDSESMGSVDPFAPPKKRKSLTGKLVKRLSSTFGGGSKKDETASVDASQNGNALAPEVTKMPSSGSVGIAETASEQGDAESSGKAKGVFAAMKFKGMFGKREKSEKS